MTTEDISTQPGAYVHANGIDIYYEEYGSGYPLLLIHGAVRDHTVWEPHIPLFAQHFRVITPDNRGQGRTKNPLDSMTYRLLADDLAAFIQALGLQQPLVCGYSDGGQITLEMGMNYPHLAKAHVIGGAWYKWPDGYVEKIKSEGIESPGVVNIEHLQQEHPDMVQIYKKYLGEHQGPEHWKSYLVQASHMWLEPLHYSDEELRGIVAPTLLLAGDRDEENMPVEHAVHMYRTLPNAELSIFPDADHFFPYPKAELFCVTIIDFLARHTLPDALEKAK